MLTIHPATDATRREVATGRWSRRIHALDPDGRGTAYLYCAGCGRRAEMTGSETERAIARLRLLETWQRDDDGEYLCDDCQTETTARAHGR